MALYVNTNVSALSGQKNLMDVTSRMNSSFEKLSSGSRINSARDDSAGLQISDRLTTQITGLNQANRNANDGISIAQIAEGALGEITSNVQRMRQLVVQGGNRTLSSDDRTALGEEFEKLLNVNNDIADRTAYGTIKLLNYDANSAGFQVQSGAFAGEQDSVTTGNAKLGSMFGKILQDEGISMSDVSLFVASDIAGTGTLGKLVVAEMVLNTVSDASIALTNVLGGVPTGQVSDFATNSAVQLQVSALNAMLTEEVSAGVAGTGAGADLTILIGMETEGQAVLSLTTATVDSVTGFSDEQRNDLHGYATDTLLGLMSDMVTQVDKQRAKLGAEQNGLSSVVRANTAAVVNVSDSRARITDTDFAAETAELTRNQIIQQAATTVLSQANQLPQTALSLLR